MRPPSNWLLADPSFAYNLHVRKSLYVLATILLVLAAIGSVYAAFVAVRRTTEPIASLTGELGTQVARVLQPTATILPDPVTIIREVRSLARLETIQYSVEKVITAETRQGLFGFLFGDRLLLVAHGTVIAGVDLGELGPDDVWLDDQARVYMRLPPAEVFVATLDNETTYVYDRDTGLLTSGSIALEAEARQAAEEEIRSAALADGILEQAQVNAENFLFRFLRSLEFQDVIFVDEGVTPPPSKSPTPHPTQTPEPTAN